MYAALSYRKIIADLGWLISARQGSNPARTDLFQDKLEQETELQPGNIHRQRQHRCIFQLSRAAPSISCFNVIVSSLIIQLRTSVVVFYALRRCLMSLRPRPGRHFCNVMTPPIPVSLCNDPINISILECSVSILFSGLWSRLVLAGSFSGSLTLSLMFSSLSQSRAAPAQHHQHPVFVFQPDWNRPRHCLS